MYRYDTHVPLVIFGGGIEPAKIAGKADMTSVAVTEARLLGITPPSASEGEVLNIF